MSWHHLKKKKILLELIDVYRSFPELCKIKARTTVTDRKEDTAY